LNRKVYVVFEKWVIFKKRVKDDEDDLFGNQSDEEDGELKLTLTLTSQTSEI
jgi:hypothetical protein